MSVEEKEFIWIRLKLGIMSGEIVQLYELSLKRLRSKSPFSFVAVVIVEQLCTDLRGKNIA